MCAQPSCQHCLSQCTSWERVGICAGYSGYIHASLACMCSSQHVLSTERCLLAAGACPGGCCCWTFVCSVSCCLHRMSHVACMHLLGGTALLDRVLDLPTLAGRGALVLGKHPVPCTDADQMLPGAWCTSVQFHHINHPGRITWIDSCDSPGGINNTRLRMRYPKADYHWTPKSPPPPPPAPAAPLPLPCRSASVAVPSPLLRIPCTRQAFGSGAGALTLPGFSDVSFHHRCSRLACAARRLAVACCAHTVRRYY